MKGTGVGILLALLTACTYGPEELSARAHQVVRLGDSYRALVVTRSDTVRHPTGLSTFPDGGKWRYTARRAEIYEIDAEARMVRRLGTLPAPDDLWESFDAWIVGLESDAVVYVQTTGCPKGGECYPGLKQTRAYRISVRAGTLEALDRVPPDARLPASMSARAPGEVHYVRFGTARDTVTARFRDDAEAERLFAVGEDGSLAPLDP